jgi:hypothetical protein
MPKSLPSLIAGLLLSVSCQAWGFHGHRLVNYHSVFLLPPGMIGFYKKHISHLADHAVDPDKRRYAVAEEGPRHFIDLDRFGKPPFDSLPRRWEAAVLRYGEDTLMRHGIVPWWVVRMHHSLTKAFREGDLRRILRYSADIGHYVSDAHVPLHATSNHNGQLTGQHGIHGFWESRIPERFAESQFDFLIGRASYLDDPSAFIWKRVLESAAAADTVLSKERELARTFPSDLRYAFEERNGKVVRQHSTAYALRYHLMLDGMVERRMRASIHSVASFWYTAWVDAGQPDLNRLIGEGFHPADSLEWKALDMQWKADRIKGRSCD